MMFLMCSEMADFVALTGVGDLIRGQPDGFTDQPEVDAGASVLGAVEHQLPGFLRRHDSRGRGVTKPETAISPPETSLSLRSVLTGSDRHIANHAPASARISLKASSWVRQLAPISFSAMLL